MSRRWLCAALVAAGVAFAVGVRRLAVAVGGFLDELDELCDELDVPVEEWSL